MVGGTVETSVVVSSELSPVLVEELSVVTPSRSSPQAERSRSEAVSEAVSVAVSERGRRRIEEVLWVIADELMGYATRADDT